MTPTNVKPLSGDTKSHCKFQPNMICSFGRLDDDADTDANADDYDGRKSDPYMSPSYAGDTKMYINIIFMFKLINSVNFNQYLI